MGIFNSTVHLSVLESATGGSKTHAFQFVVLLPFHPAILEPNLNLPLRQAQRVGYLYPPPPGQIPIEMELFLQLKGLVAGVRGSGPFPIRSSHIYMARTTRNVRTALFIFFKNGDKYNVLSVLSGQSGYECASTLSRHRERQHSAL